MEKIKDVRKKYVYRFCCTLLLSVFATLIYGLIWYNFVEDNNITGHLLGKANLGMAIGIYYVMFCLIGKNLRAFKIGVDRMLNIVIALALTCCTVAVLDTLVSLAVLGQFRLFWKILGIYLLMAIGQMIILTLLAIPMTLLYRRLFPPLELLEVYGEYANGLAFKMEGRRDKYHISKMVNYQDGIEKIYPEIKNYDAVLINDIPSDVRNEIVKKCYEDDKRVYFTPKISDIIMKSSEELNLFDTPLCVCKNIGLSNIQLCVKRLFDIVLSGIALVLLSPLFIIVSFCIHQEDGGPVFFRQERVTLKGRRFMILKFRSMIVGAEKDGRPHPAGENDDRITRVGKFIRTTRIDELPQLINIFKGDMSIVGPRPERWEHDEIYSKEVPEWPLRLKVKGGLTGYAQVYGKYNTTALDKLKLDLYYITNFSLVLDIQIIFETIKILVRKESTEGFDEERGKAMHDENIMHNKINE